MSRDEASAADTLCPSPSSSKRRCSRLRRSGRPNSFVQYATSNSSRGALPSLSGAMPAGWRAGPYLLQKCI